MGWKSDNEGVTKENQRYFHNLMLDFRDRFIRLQVKHNALKRTLHLIIDAAIEANNEKIKWQNKCIELESKIKKYYQD